MDLIALDPHLATGDFEVRIVLSLSGDDVELPAVPGAFDEISHYASLSQWPSGMWTGIIKGIDHTFEIK